MSCSLQSVLAQLPRIAVSVNGVPIPHDAVAREVQHHPERTPVRAWQQAARALAVRELLLQEARRQGLTAGPQGDGDGRRETDDEALIRGLVERDVGVPEADEATCRRYYDRNRGRFRSRDIYQASHILIAARRDEPAAFGAARVCAERLLALLEDDPARFAELAALHSACPSAASGGSLGQLTRGGTTPEFEQAIFLLAPGETTAAPVETRYGFHIIRLDRMIPGRQLPFGLVRERIARYLTERARRVGIAQYLARLAARARITGVDLPSATDLRLTGGTTSSRG
jgi:peptidyl-prolyl cis-trans isomerase C